MPQVSEYVERSLREIVGDRIRTDRVERKLYSADIGALPKLVAPFVPAGVAGAVVRPMDEPEIVSLTKLARERGLSLVPRGASTSGYGGVLPREGAVVVDLSGMDKVLDVDAKALTARVQPGIIWEPLQKRLNRDGLDLRLYPSSTPSSTVGGWLAQGGSGFGSYEYGAFKENVVSARVVLPDGDVRTFDGPELERLVADAEGITGFITEVVIRLRRFEPEVHRLMSFRDADSLTVAVSLVSERAVPVWSLTFLNPASIALKKRLPHRHRHPYENAEAIHEPALPESYILVVAYPESRRSQVDDALTAIVEAAGGIELDREAAEHEWEQRFAPMRLKRIGPSIIPTEVVVPLLETPGVLAEIADKIHQPFILEGMVGKGDKVVLLGFIPHDQRSLAFNAAFALSLSVIAIAKRHGGSAYSTGLYFRREAGSVLGDRKLDELAEFKRRHDPAGLMNPGKVLGRGTIDGLMGMASTFEPLVRPIANLARPPATNKMVERRGIPADVGLFAYACAQCGYCVPTCEEYTGRGLDESFAARQVPLPARGHGGPGEVRPAHGGHLPGLHDL